MTIKRGFTLVEILVAVMLTGMLAGLALAPVAITVRRTIDTQREYADMSALSRTVNFIARDIFQAMRLSSNVLMIADHEALGNRADDALLFMTTTPAVQGMAAGTVVYKTAEGGILHNNIIPGLYRWIFPGKMPNSINTETLKGEEGQLVLPGVTDFSVEIPTGSHEDDRKKEYSGPLPKGVCIKIARKSEGKESEIERIIVFP